MLLLHLVIPELWWRGHHQMLITPLFNHRTGPSFFYSHPNPRILFFNFLLLFINIPSLALRPDSQKTLWGHSIPIIFTEHEMVKEKLCQCVYACV